MSAKMRAFWQSDVVKTWNPAQSGPKAGPAPTDVASADGDESGGAAQGGSKIAGPGAPASTGADLFVDWNSPALTDSAKKALDAYAKAYLDAKSSETIVVDAYASTDGDEKHNQNLSDNRAHSVEEYLIQKGVPKDKVKAKGHGETDSFSKTDLGQNRRATLKPPPPQIKTPSAPTGPGRLSMRDPKPLTGDKDKKVDLNVHKDPNSSPPPLKPEVVPIATVEQELKRWLQKLGKSQNHKDDKVRSTAIVRVAEEKLHGRGYPPGEDDNLEATTPVDGDQQDYSVSDLARKIIAKLPPKGIAKKNFDHFKKLGAEDIKLPPKTVTGQLNKKFHELRDKLVSKLPKAVQPWAKKGIDKLIEKGRDYAIDKVIQEVGVPENLKGEVKKALED